MAKVPDQFLTGAVPPRPNLLGWVGNYLLLEYLFFFFAGQFCVICARCMKDMHAYAVSNQLNNGGITAVCTVSRDMRDSFAWYHAHSNRLTTVA